MRGSLTGPKRRPAKLGRRTTRQTCCVGIAVLGEELGALPPRCGQVGGAWGMVVVLSHTSIVRVRLLSDSRYRIDSIGGTIGVRRGRAATEKTAPANCVPKRSLPSRDGRIRPECLIRSQMFCNVQPFGRSLRSRLQVMGESVRQHRTEVTDRVLCTRSLPSIGVIATALVSIYGCTLGDPASPHEQVLDGTEWTLMVIETADGTIDATVLRNPAWVGFEVHGPEEDSSRVYGFGGCNSFGGKYRVVGSQLTVSDLWITDGPCAASISRVEVPFVMGLDNALQFSVSRGELRVLSSGDTALNLSIRVDP